MQWIRSWPAVLICSTLTLVASPPARAQVAPTVEACGQPLYFFGGIGQPGLAVAVLAAPAGGPLAELEVEVDVQHSAIGQIEIDVSAPDGTTVRLHDRQTLGLFDDDVILRYTDRGLPNGVLPYNSGCPVRPSGDASGPLEDTLSAINGPWGGLWTIVVRDVVYPGGIGQLASWCVRFWDTPQPPLPFGPIDLQWSWASPSYSLSWTNTHAYDLLEVLVDGSPVATLSGSSTTYSIAAPDGLPHQVCLRASVAGEVLCREACGWVAPGVAAVSVCDPTPVMVDDETTLRTIAVGAAPFVVGDARVRVALTHDDPRDVTVAVRSPQGTQVVLHDLSGASLPHLDVTFWDLGPEVTQVRDCGCFVRPDGPGSLVDFVGEPPAGSWELEVSETDANFAAHLDEWCLELFSESPPFAVEDFQCVPGVLAGTIIATWVNPVSYDSLEVLRDGVPVAVVQGTTTSYTLPPVPFTGSYTVCVRPEKGGYFGPSSCSDVSIDIEPPLAPWCESFPGSGVATIQWVNPRLYDAVHVSIDGNSVAVLPGNPTSFSTSFLGTGTQADICVRGELQGVLTSNSCCIVALVPAFDVDFEVCSEGSVVIDAAHPDILDTIVVGAQTTVADLEVDVAIRYLAVSLIVVDLESPAGTVVRLHDEAGVGTRLQLTYSDHGVPNTGFLTSHGCQCRMQASGDGAGPLADALAAFQGEDAMGEWQLRVATSFPLPGSLASWCLRFDGACPVPEPTVLTCSNVAGAVVVDWQNGATYDSIEVLRDGAPIATLQGDATAFTGPSPSGSHEYSVVGVLNGCGHPSTVCRIAVGVTDLVFRGEHALGRVDSVFALEQQLLALGRSVAVVDEFSPGVVATFDGSVQRIWMMLGTFPHNHVLTSDEGFLLAELHTGDVGLDGTTERSPIAVYIEGNDVWGFDPVTAFSAYDGVENGTVARGDDSLTQVIGSNTGIGLTLNGLQSGYYQDQEGNDRTDRLRATGTTPGFAVDVGGSQAAIAWTASAGYGVGIFYASSFAPVFAQSFEIGGYSASLSSVVQRYLGALQVSHEDPFRRGDFDHNGALQLGDAVGLLAYLFLSGSTPTCLDGADFDDDGGVDVADGVALLSYLFLGTAPPPAPGLTCGPDPTVDGLADCDYPSGSCP